MTFTGILTTLSLSVLIVPMAYGQNKYNLPQVVNGNSGSISYRTTFVLLNNSDTPAAVSLNLTDDSGNPLKATVKGQRNRQSF